MEMTIKNSWEDITIQDYYEIVDIMNSKLETDDFSKEMRLLQVVTGMEEAELNKLQVKEFAGLLKHLSFLGTPIPEEKVKAEYIIRGTVYRPVLNIGDMQTYRYINCVRADPKNFHTILQNCFHIPMDEETVLQMGIIEANALGVFFLKLYAASKAIIEGSSDMQKKRKKKVKKS